MTSSYPIQAEQGGCIVLGSCSLRKSSSRARGDAGPDSDFDFLVVERNPQDRHAEMVRLGRALRPLGMPFDVVVVSERYVDDWEGVEGSMVHAALTEGRVLHAAA